ncbi:MAG: hypothetical protein GVY28_11000, partial [Alphaproteobacteria bacterium]|nr:hypothetical protein [Alphaproteobacteria bacterium]
MPAPDHHDAMAAVAAMAAMPAPQIGDLLRQRRMPEARRALSALRDPEIADTIAELGPPLDGLALRVLPRDRAA